MFIAKAVLLHIKWENNRRRWRSIYGRNNLHENIIKIKLTLIMKFLEIRRSLRSLTIYLKAWADLFVWFVLIRTSLELGKIMKMQRLIFLINYIKIVHQNALGCSDLHNINPSILMLSYVPKTHSVSYWEVPTHAEILKLGNIRC